MTKAKIEIDTWWTELFFLDENVDAVNHIKELICNRHDIDYDAIDVTIESSGGNDDD